MLSITIWICTCIYLYIFLVITIHTCRSKLVFISWPIQLKSSNVGMILNLWKISTNKNIHKTSVVRVQLVLTVVSCAVVFSFFVFGFHKKYDKPILYNYDERLCEKKKNKKTHVSAVSSKIPIVNHAWNYSHNSHLSKWMNYVWRLCHVDLSQCFSS